MRRFFDHDPLTGDCEFFHFDEMTGDFAIETVGDVEPVIEANKRLLTDGSTGYSPSRDMKRIASVPMNIYLKWKQELGVDMLNKDHEKKVKQLLNDPDWRYLRTAPGVY